MIELRWVITDSMDRPTLQYREHGQDGTEEHWKSVPIVLSPDYKFGWTNPTLNSALHGSKVTEAIAQLPHYATVGDLLKKLGI